jgi:hypothetical protein
MTPSDEALGPVIGQHVTADFPDVLASLKARTEASSRAEASRSAATRARRRSKTPSSQATALDSAVRVLLRWQRLMTATLRPFGLTHVQFVLLASLWWLTEKADERPSQRRLADFAATDAMMTEHDRDAPRVGRHRIIEEAQI